jgi:hypothetical protein
MGFVTIFLKVREHFNRYDLGFIPDEGLKVCKNKYTFIDIMKAYCKSRAC